MAMYAYKYALKYSNLLNLLHPVNILSYKLETINRKFGGLLLVKFNSPPYYIPHSPKSI